MDLLLWKTCDLCKGLFRKRDMVHNVMIGPHYPWTFCKICYEKKEETK